MKKTLIRVLSVFLALVLIVGIVPMSVFAVNSQGSHVNYDSDVSFEADSGLGLILSNLEETNVDENNSGCSILNITIKERTAYVRCSTQTKCKLVVAIYDENTNQLLGTGIKDINVETYITSLSLDIPKLPEYFIVKGYMLSDDYSPLSNVFTFYEYTSIYEQFMSVTPDEFDAERVIQLGEDIEVSFAALSRDVEIADFSSKMTADYDAEKGIYTFLNATEDIKKLKKGEVLYYPESKDDFILLKVSSISVDKDTVRITEDVDISLEEAFDYVRLDEGASFDNISPEDITTGDCLTANDKIEILDADEYSIYDEFSGNASTQSNEEYGDEGTNIKGELFKETFEIDFPNQKAKTEEEKSWLEKGIKVTGSIGFVVGASCRLHWDIRIGDDYFEYKIEVETKVDFNVKVTGSLKVNPDVVYFQLDGKDKNGNPKGIPVGKIFKLYIKVYPVAEFTGELELASVSLFNLKGALLSSKDGYQKLQGDYKKIIDADKPSLKFVFKLGVGIEFEVGRRVGDKDEKGDQKIMALVVIDFKIYIIGNLETDQTDKKSHPCTVCVKANIGLEVNGSGTIEVKIFKLLSKIKNEKIKKYVGDNGKAEIKIADITCTIPFGEGYLSWHDGGFDMGWGICPNIRTLITVYVQRDTVDKEPIKDANVTVSSDSYKTDEDGKVELYLKHGKTYTIKVVYNSVEKSKNIAVSLNDKDVFFAYSEDELNKDPNDPVDPNKPNNPNIPGVISHSVSGTILTISGSGNMTNFTNYISGQPWASLRQTVTKIVVEPGVTSIGDNAFYQFVKLESVSIPNTVTYIGDGAFYECNSLQKIELPNSVDTIADYAFYGCKSLGTADLGSSVKTIGAEAFCLCSSLSKIVIPTSCTNVGDKAFNLCYNLSRIDFENKDCVIYDGASTIYSGASIYGYSDSSAYKYAKKYNRTFKQAMFYTQSVINSTEIYDSYSITYSACVASENYILLNVTGYGTNFELTTTNLEYIDQLTANASGKVSCNFIPRNSVSGSTTLLIGDFGNGTETKIVTPRVSSTSVEIVNNPGVLTINYMEGIRLYADIISPVDGCDIQWYINGTAYTTGDTIEIQHISDETKITVKLVDTNGNPILKNGEEIISEETIKVNSGFFQKLIAFFKFTLFRQVVLKTN